VRRLVLVPLAAIGVGAAGYVPWEDLTEADRLFAVATRFAEIDGGRVHYPTPTVELERALAAMPDPVALRHLAEARRELGDLPGALAALEKWAEAEGAAAWAEAARWGAAHGETAFAFRAAERAREGLRAEEKRALLDDEVSWADAHPDAADPLAVRQARADAFPDDAGAAEDWIRALEKADRLEDAEKALAAAPALSPERRLLLRSDLLADHGQARRAFDVLDAVISGPWSPDVRQAYARRTDEASPASPEAWRASLERGFDTSALLRLATYFQGQGRGDAAAALLQQVERRYEASFDRAAWRLLARLESEIDAVPEAFRSTLAASSSASAAEQADDLGALAHLALRAGARALPWGRYNDEPYRWVARIDRTPGFWTGGVSFLLTGQDWKDALGHLESESLPDRTLATARALRDELARRNATHPSLPALQVAIMARHVERGEGREALALLPVLQSTPLADEARRQALLAMRQVEVPLADELDLWRQRLRTLAPDGARPLMEAPHPTYASVGSGSKAWQRPPPIVPGETYREALDEALARLDRRDRTHRAALGLVLGEMDRLPDAEGLWEYLASRLEAWNLDDDLGPRYERALERFPGEGWWARAARWYARRQRSRDLERLADELVGRFRAAAIFARAVPDGSVRLVAQAQPRAGTRVRLVAWADWVRLRALERFPHSPAVFAQAKARLLRRSDGEKAAARLDRETPQRVVVEDALYEERRIALVFADPARREEYLADAMKDRSLERRLAEWEAAPSPTPVHDRLLMEGWARLSRFERAAEPALRLHAAYPGDGDLARRVLSLVRSLASLDPGRAAAAPAIVARTAPALADPGPLWVELGELQEESGRPDAARASWQHLLDRDPRNPERSLELATVLWDYSHSREALAVVEDARQRLSRPALHAFEAGVLREEQRDVDGAVREYLAAGVPDPETSDCFCSSFESDQRSLRRLSQLLGRDRPRADVERRIASLRAGEKADERALVALLPLAGIVMPDASYDWTADDWIDALDIANDPRGRDARKAAREDWRPRAREGMAAVTRALRAKALEMIPRATEAAFLDALDPWRSSLSCPLRPCPGGVEKDADAETDWQSAVLARRAELAPTPEERVAREVERARFLLEHGRLAEADRVWSALAPKVDALPQGAARLRAEADRAAYVERARGTEAAVREWTRLGAKYPWSLGLLEDRLAFLLRVGRGAEERQVLESVVPRAGAGHREALLERLLRESLEAPDLATARRAASTVLGEPSLDAPRRLAAIRLVGRLSFRENAGFDALGLAGEQQAKVEPERRADVYAELARGAHEEGRDKAATTLWIEALNRRLERAWLREAAFAADLAGEGPSLLAFFERQRSASPRDVRWAVALRELRLQAGDTEGAVEAARAAVAVRPDRESLWREAADLLVRAGRVPEAASLVADWQKARPADEEAARWRADLLARTGALAEAAAAERKALEAYAREAPADETRTQELASRRGRAARRMLDRGSPKEAWELLAPGGDLARAAEAALGDAGTAEAALAADRFLRYLRFRDGDGDYWSAAARVLVERGTPERKDEVLAFLVRALAPATPPSREAFARHWAFARDAEMEGTLRRTLARRAIAAAPGPWSSSPSAAFEETVAEQVLETGSDGEPSGLRTVRLGPLWVRDLVRRDDAEGLYAFLEPRWTALLAQVGGATPITRDPARLDWASWLDDSGALGLWSRAAARRTERAAELGAVFADPRRWDRLWALAARDHWSLPPLVALLPDDARTAWLARGQSPSPSDPDPARRARATTLERAGVALGRLVAGVPGAEADPVVVELRGPLAIGEILGREPRFDPAWEESPGAAWYVLDALLRLRARDPDAALVPLEARRGREAERARVAAAIAEAEGDAGLALSLAPEAATRLRLLVGSRRTADAEKLLEEEVRREQPRLTEAAFRTLVRAAADLDLSDPVAHLDPEVPVPGTFLAFLADRYGVARARTLAAKDVVDFRSALAGRWRERPTPLSADELRFYLSELWAAGAAPLPERGLRPLGGLWPAAATWLERIPGESRAEALPALEALPDSTKLEALLARSEKPEDDVVRLLRVRVHLLRGEDDRALALVDEVVRELDRGAVSWAPAPLAEPVDEEAEGGPETEPSGDAATARVRAYLAPFREARRVPLAADHFRQALRSRLRPGPASADTWALALELAPAGDERAALASEMDRAFLRGDLRNEELARVADAVARFLPSEAPRWLARVPPAYGFDAAAARARTLRRLGDRAAAARVLVDARPRGAWTEAEELRAFDLWREVAPATVGKDDAPAAWAAARTFWTEKAADVSANLAAHLSAHPFDVRAARAALRSVAPADDDTARRSAATLRESTREGGDDTSGDDAVLRVRAARGFLGVSATAARTALGGIDTRWLLGELAKRRFPQAEVRGALADVARIERAGAGSGDRAMVVLEDQDPAAARALRQETRERPSGPWLYRIDAGRPAAWRPRDLDWSVLARALDAPKATEAP
jgi:predicted Zn-dependent protease